MCKLDDGETTTSILSIFYPGDEFLCSTDGEVLMMMMMTM